MNGVLVILEQRTRAGARSWSGMSWETLAAGQELAGLLGQPLMAAVAGASGAEPLAAEMAGRELARALFVRHDLLEPYTADSTTGALEQVVKALDPACVLLPHTYRVRDFAPRLATRFGEMLIADAIGLHADGGAPVFVRQLVQGKLNADYRHVGPGPCFVSIQAGSFRADTLRSGSCTVETFEAKLDASAVRNQPEEPFRESEQTVDLASAAVIVSVGRGIREQENLPVVEELAQALGAELAASRPICDNGWLPMERQVGSSGQTVSPKLYIAVGFPAPSSTWSE